MIIILIFAALVILGTFIASLIKKKPLKLFITLAGTLAGFVLGFMTHDYIKERSDKDILTQMIAGAYNEAQINLGILYWMDTKSLWIISEAPKEEIIESEELSYKELHEKIDYLIPKTLSIELLRNLFESELSNKYLHPYVVVMLPLYYEVLSSYNKISSEKTYENYFINPKHLIEKWQKDFNELKKLLHNEGERLAGQKKWKRMIKEKEISSFIEYGDLITLSEKLKELFPDLKY